MFASGRFGTTLTLLVLPLLAACANTVTTQPVVPVVVGPPPVNPILPAPIPARPQTQARVTAPAPVPAIPQAPPVPPRDEAGVRAAFGTPSLVRQEAQSEMWRYDGAGCALFVFLYRENDAVLVRHMETLPQGATSDADETCLAGIRARKAS